MNEDTNVNTQMSEDNDDVRDGEIMKKELGAEGIEIESNGSESADENIVEEEEEEEEEDEFPSDSSAE